MDSFGQRLGKMRRQRGFSSRDSLARATGLSLNTIARTESSKTCRLQKANAAKIIAALGAAAPLTEEEREWWAEHAGLSLAYIERISGPGDPEPGPAHSKAAGAVQTRFNVLLSYAGPNVMHAMLDLVVELRSLQHADPGRDASPPSEDEEPRLLNIHEPPVQHDGYYEQVIRTVEVVNKPPESEQKPGDSTQKRGDGAG